MNTCCEDKTNLVITESREGVEVKICRICTKRHIEMVAKPGHFGITLKG